MRSVAMTLAVIVFAAACAAPTVGTYPDTPPDDGSNDLPDRQSDQPAADAGTGLNGTGFTAAKPKITVTLAGTGTGTITSTPGGITCAGTTCTGSFTKGTAVTLLPTPAAGSIFAGWTGTACTGAASCAPVVSADVALTAQFETFDGTWSGNYTHNEAANGCQFNNAGTMSMAITKTATAFSSTTNMTGFQLKNIPGCELVSTQNGTATAALTAAGSSVSGNLPVQISGAGGTLPLPFTAAISGKTMTGTWTCTGCTGTFTITKQ